MKRFLVDVTKMNISFPLSTEALYNSYADKPKRSFDTFLYNEINSVIHDYNTLNRSEFIYNLETRIDHFPHIERLENTYQFLTDILQAVRNTKLA